MHESVRCNLQFFSLTTHVARSHPSSKTIAAGCSIASYLTLLPFATGFLPLSAMIQPLWRLMLDSGSKIRPPTTLALTMFLDVAVRCNHAAYLAIRPPAALAPTRPQAVALGLSLTQLIISYPPATLARTKSQDVVAIMLGWNQAVSAAMTNQMLVLLVIWIAMTV